jgi:hypothetical protein
VEKECEIATSLRIDGAMAPSLSCDAGPAEIEFPPTTTLPTSNRFAQMPRGSIDWNAVERIPLLPASAELAMQCR